MSPHPEELLQIYIILGPFASNRSETGEIPVILQDSLSGIVVHIELLYFCRISLTESASLEKSWSLRISPAGWACLGKWFSFQGGRNIHFPTQNFFLNSLTSAAFPPIIAFYLVHGLKLMRFCRNLCSGVNVIRKNCIIAAFRQVER
ncbi:hypothetical protein [Paenibacillus dendritiformis]|uniref:hypothetical protein n=1 Tax=Paenibacillus dendritiformis TaxID=130049 RepID=UPI001BCE88A4|nr:hypothetical protein [Paenibacillus dendritiformis]